MLPGISGSLIAPAFLATVLTDEFCARFEGAPRIRRLHQWWRRVERSLGPSATARAVADAGAMPLFETLGYDLERLEPHGEGLVGTVARRDGPPVALRICPWGADTDTAWRETVRVGRASGAHWGVIYTGPTLRLVDATRTWSRRALDFNLARALTHERSAVTFVALLEAAGADADSHCSLVSLLKRSDRHGVEVCSTLGDGVLDALTTLVTALDAGGRRRAPPPPDRAVFEQAVTLVYRLLFLLFAEARALVPTWHHVYRDAYTIDALCQRFMARPERRGLWRALQAIARLAHTGCRAGDLVVTPFNGRLFSPRHTPLAERARVPDPVIGQTLMSLATRSSRRGRERIFYADLGVEQLGAVYERVLEYEPTRAAGALRLARTSHERKATGSFYTPRAMTDFLVRRALHPLVTGRSTEQILQLRVLDPAMGSGAFLVGACRYLSHAAERTTAAEGAVPIDRTVDEASRIRRAVAQQCLFGVDLNPMAVQLARLSLWLASLAGDRPLAFLDHHLMAGDSLIGASFADLTRNPDAARQRDRAPGDPLPLFGSDAAHQIATSVLPERFRIATEPGDTPSAVRQKERRLAELSAPGTPLAGWKRAADLWCASWFWNHDRLTNGVYADVLGSLTGRASALTPEQRMSILGRAAATARAQQFFHWELEFPEVFFTPDGQRHAEGGFDAVIGNPPWDVLRADSGPRAERDRTRASQTARRRFFREAQVYRHQSGGHANQYQLFIERALQLVRPGGRVALILPSGLATDHGSRAVRHALLDALDIDRLIGFDNREVIFPIHRDVRFLLITGTKGGPTTRLTGAFGRSDPAWLDQLPDATIADPPDARPIVLSRALLASWDPEHVAIPWLPSRDDVDLLATITDHVPRLGDTAGWGIRFGRELNATDDRHHFVPLGTPGEPRLLRIVEGKHLEPFRVLAANATMGVTAARAARLVDAARSFERARLAYRDVASATNRVTLITAILPPGTISTHTVFCAKSALGDEATHCLLALLNSLVANYLVRLQVTTHVTCALMARLPIPRPSSKSAEFRTLAALARSLAQTGVTGHEAEYARINAIVAQLYGLSRSQYEHILSTFPLLSTELLSHCSSAHGRN
ncbi:MAG TPA: N-6 DNA methylase [Vicinamibacterales bacterium]|nr:N-6 DNA methylase [Vicinamibacterales bacterium]